MINEERYIAEKHLQTDEEEQIVIWHDNGVPGQEGCTVYTESEIKACGGITELMRKYKAAGITIIHIC